MSRYDVDLSEILIKPLYFGLLMNIFIPVLIVGIAYFLDKSGGIDSSLQKEQLNIFFWVLLAVSLADGALAVYWKSRNFLAPMIISKETFGEDLGRGVFTQSIICYSMTTAIAVYGLVFYLLGGTFMHLLFFVFVSFIAFQLIRPRLGFLEKVLAAQEKHVEEGRFLARKN